MSTQSEAALEAGLIATLRQMDYEYVQIVEEDNLYANFKRQLEIHNRKRLEEHGRTEFTAEEFEKILIYLEGGTRFEKAKKLRDLYPLDTADGQRIWVEFLNRQQWCQNEFQVSNQITVEGRKKCRYDVTILINGLPLVQIELKRRGVELKQAYNQIQRYHKTSFHGLFDYIQLFVISNGVNTRYFANNPNSGYKFTFTWTDAANHPFNELDKFAVFFLEKCTLGKIIGKYIVLHEGDKCLMVLRPYQFYAVEKILDRVQNSNDNGYIWHTTGAGKTLTSFKAAQLVSELDDVDKVMFVVDRHDLDTQTQSEYEAFEPGAVDSTDNTDELVKRLQSNSKIIITTIQKLNAAVSKTWYSSKIDAIRHSRIVMIFDECHRSHFGDSHKKIMKFFGNAQIFGFTGTPIFTENAVDGRKVTIENTAAHPAVIELLDGMPQVIPYGVSMESTKNMIQTAKAWMQVEQAQKNVPYFRVRASMEDTADVTMIEGGNFGIGFAEDGTRLEAITDPETVFGYDNSLGCAVVYEQGGITEVDAQTQSDANLVPCCMFAKTLRMEARTLTLGRQMVKITRAMASQPRSPKALLDHTPLA